MTENTISVDMDKACSKCGQMGATGNGLCLACVTDSLGPDKLKLVHESLISASKQLNALMATYSLNIYRAYLQAEDGKLSVGLTVELSPSEEIANAIKVKAKINFIESRIKDESTVRVSGQEKLPLGDA